MKSLIVGVIVCVLSFGCLGLVLAGDVEIQSAEFKQSRDNRWDVAVTLRHGDTGWEHYVDGWRIVGPTDEIIGERVLYHPHVNEQPFTISLSGVTIPEKSTTVFIEAHDSVHGWAAKRLEINLNTIVDGRLMVKSQIE